MLKRKGRLTVLSTAASNDETLDIYLQKHQRREKRDYQNSRHEIDSLKDIRLLSRTIAPHRAIVRQICCSTCRLSHVI